MIIILMFLLIFGAVIWLMFARMHKQYSNVKRLMPSDTKHITRIVPMGNEFKELFHNDKSNPINYLVGNANKQISFPESYIQNSKFYLTGIEFKPNIDQTVNQKSNLGAAVTGYAIAGGLGAAIGASKKHKTTIKNNEHQTIGIIHLYSVDDGRIHSFRIQMDSNKYKELVGLYLLGPNELHEVMPTM